MKSLSELNSFADQSFELTDGRPARAVFDRPRPQPQVLEFDDGDLTVTIAAGTEIIEIINYSTANVRYVLKVRSAVATPMTASTITWATLPTGVTAVESPAETYTVSGLTSVSDWDTIKNPTWTLPSDYASAYQWFYLEASIIYFDQDLDRDVTITWDVYDINYYPTLQINTAFTITPTVAKIVSPAVAMTVTGATLELSTRVRFAASLMASSGTLFCETAPIKEPELPVFTAAFTQATVDGQRIRTITEDYAATFTQVSTVGKLIFYASQMTVTAGPIGPGGAAYLEGNGFVLDTGLGYWPAGFPGIVRIRPLDSSMNSQSSLVAEGYNLPFIWTLENYQSQFTATIVPEIFLGPSDTVLPVNSSVTASSTVFYDSFVSAMQSNATLTARPIKNGKANLSVQSNLSCIGTNFANIELEIVIPSGTSAQRTFGLTFTGTTAVIINWGDGTTTTASSAGTYNKTYSTSGTYNVSVVRNTASPMALQQWRVSSNTSNNQALRRCLSFGTLGTTSLESAFSSQTELIEVPKIFPISVISINQMFALAQKFNDPNVSYWNTANITNMFGVFSQASLFNQPLNNWDTSSVTTMESMFDNTIFNQPLNNWDTSSVTSMIGMFSFATNFDQDISNWCVELIPSKPLNFDRSTSINWTTAEKPNWGAPC